MDQYSHERSLQTVHRQAAEDERKIPLPSPTSFFEDPAYCTKQGPWSTDVILTPSPQLTHEGPVLTTPLLHC